MFQDMYEFDQAAYEEIKAAAARAATQVKAFCHLEQKTESNLEKI